MREKLRNDLLVLMDDYLEPDKLREVVPMLESILSNYEIKKRETEIIVYGSDIPETVKTYIVAKKNIWFICKLTIFISYGFN